jgi:cobalt-zinc-cadmium efflux system outer membrane protein
VLLVDVQAAPLPLPSAGIVARAGVPSSSALTGAFNGRPQTVVARERVAAATAGVTTERTMFLRELSATLGTKQTEGARGLIAGVSLPFPLFDQNRGEIARAQAEREAVAFELVAAERSARAEIIGALGAARVLTDRAVQLSTPGPDGQPAYLARADEARRIALGAYREGAVPLLTVIDAARAWGEARLAYYETIYAQHESVLALLAAQGLDLRLATGSAPVGAPSSQER